MQRINRNAPDGDGNKVGSSSSCVDPVPQSLKEVIELMSSVNRRLEDCGVEWQASVSRKQWRIIQQGGGSSGEHKTTWEQSLLARTYFVDKCLDEAFGRLMGSERKFLEDLNNFIGLLQGETPMHQSSKDAQNQCRMSECVSGTSSPGRPTNPVVTPLDLSLLDDTNKEATVPGQNNNTTERRRSRRLATSVNPLQQSFADLIKAKIDLDTKFLGFEAMLNGTPSPPPSEGAKCLCQICSNVLGDVIENDVRKPKIRKTNRSRIKRSPKLWKRITERINSQSVISNVNKNYPDK